MENWLERLKVINNEKCEYNNCYLILFTVILIRQCFKYKVKWKGEISYLDES